MREITTRTLGAVCGLALVAAGAQADHPVKDIVTEDGVFTVPVERPAGPYSPGPMLRNADWSYTTSPGRSESVALTAEHTWAGVTTGDRRLLRFVTDGDGTPELDLPAATSGSPGVVAASYDGSRAAYLTESVNGNFVVELYDASGSEPIWTYEFEARFGTANSRTLAMSRDGSTIAVGARDGTDSRVAFLDAEEGTEISTYNEDPGGFLTGLNGVDISDDGSRAMVTLANRPRVVDTATGDLIWSGSGSGSGNVHYRISGDGNVIAVGGFDLEIYEWDGSEYRSIIFFPGNEWFGFGTVISGDGSTVASLARDSDTESLYFRAWDVDSRQLLVEEFLPGVTDSRNISSRASAATEDGSLFAFANWGDGRGEYPEIMVFDREGEMVASIDMPGSGEGVDIAPDGSWVAGSGRDVHANVTGTGQGGQVVAKQLEADIPCIADWNGDGEVDINDFFAYLSDFEDGDPRADLNNDGEIDINDFFIFLQEFEEGC